MASGTASSAHQVDANNETSSLDYKVLGMLEHPPKIGHTADSENISDVTDPLHSKLVVIAQDAHEDHDTHDDSSLSKKPKQNRRHLHHLT